MRLLACLTEKLFGGLQAFFRLVLACIDGLAVRQQPVQRVLRRSVEYAFEHPAASLPFVRAHAQAMSDEVMQAHIRLYVTRYTVSLGEKGRQAVRLLFDTAVERGVIPAYRAEFLGQGDSAFLN